MHSNFYDCNYGLIACDYGYVIRRTVYFKRKPMIAIEQIKRKNFSLPFDSCRSLSCVSIPLSILKATVPRMISWKPLQVQVTHFYHRRNDDADSMRTGCRMIAYRMIAYRRERETIGSMNSFASHNQSANVVADHSRYVFLYKNVYTVHRLMKSLISRANAGIFSKTKSASKMKAQPSPSMGNLLLLTFKVTHGRVSSRADILGPWSIDVERRRRQ